jgi:type IV pilus assembly protein PilW
MKARTQKGMTLIELMVALAIGAFLMIGAITVFMQSRTSFRVTESLARMQENARFALDALEPDIRMANYWGLTSTASLVRFRARPTQTNGLGDDSCGINWLINLDEAIEGTNNSYGFGCAAVGGPAANADTLTVRRASEDPVTAPLNAATLHIQSARPMIESQLFAGSTTAPAGYDPFTSQTHRLMVSGYYVSQSSSLGNNVPSLRVKTLLADSSIQDQEVMPGVEDFQVQFGVDTDAADTNERGSIDRYVDPDDPMIDPDDAAFDPNSVVMAVRIWLRIRAERPENGFTDTANYVYADQNVGPFNDGFRRFVVSKTIYLRNSRPLS